MDFYFSADFDDGYGSSSFGLDDFENGSHYLVFFFLTPLRKRGSIDQAKLSKNVQVGDHQNGAK